ncbi:hypothetical protein Bbelb_277230 [Branchiostoma belcheri]|nr:hypothetical protein Bbelb_277230 [Branchiostoma belcheri]
MRTTGQSSTCLVNCGHTLLYTDSNVIHQTWSSCFVVFSLRYEGHLFDLGYDLERDEEKCRVAPEQEVKVGSVRRSFHASVAGQSISQAFPKCTGVHSDQGYSLACYI